MLKLLVWSDVTRWRIIIARAHYFLFANWNFESVGGLMEKWTLVFCLWSCDHHYYRAVLSGRGFRPSRFTLCSLLLNPHTSVWKNVSIFSFVRTIKKVYLTLLPMTSTVYILDNLGVWSLQQEIECQKYSHCLWVMMWGAFQSLILHLIKYYFKSFVILSDYTFN